MSGPRDDSPELLRRREILRRAAWLLGGVVSAPAAFAMLQGCSAGETGGDAQSYVPKLLDTGQFAIVDEIAAIMIPRTATAGARDARVAPFIDGVLAAVYPPHEQVRFKQGCDAFATAAPDGRPFLNLEPAARVAVVRHSLETALTAGHREHSFILATRELALLGYFSSQVGITENMEYVAVPTAFHGCVPLSQMSKHVYWE